jgi:hypothetical protein
VSLSNRQPGNRSAWAPGLLTCIARRCLGGCLQHRIPRGGEECDGGACLVKLVGDFGNHSESPAHCTAKQRIERCAYASPPYIKSGRTSVCASTEDEGTAAMMARWRVLPAEDTMILVSVPHIMILNNSQGYTRRVRRNFLRISDVLLQATDATDKSKKDTYEEVPSHDDARQVCALPNDNKCKNALAWRWSETIANTKVIQYRRRGQ